MNYWLTMLAILAALSSSMALAEDFATINGKEYENATVTRVEADGIVIRTKGDTRVAAADFDFSITNLFIAILVIVIPLVPMIAIVPGVLAQRRREQRALLFKQGPVTGQQLSNKITLYPLCPQTSC